MDNLEKRSRATDARITNRIQEIEERISDIKDTIENTDTSVKENTKCKLPNPKYKRNSGHNERIKPKNNRTRRR
jgi:regulator of replication initiation timing